jgi:hypothetical protein
LRILGGAHAPHAPSKSATDTPIVISDKPFCIYINGELFMPVSQRVQMNFLFTDNVRILCLSCNVKKVWKLVRFRQKGQKQASFIAFHECCQGCLLRGPRYQFHTCLRPPQYIATGYQESLFVGWKVYSSSTNKAKIYLYSIFVQQMYWLQDK